MRSHGLIDELFSERKNLSVCADRGTKTASIGLFLLPLNKREREFIDRLNDAGDIVPQLLTDDPAMQRTIHEQPGLKWKALNVKKRAHGESDDGPPI